MAVLRPKAAVKARRDTFVGKLTFSPPNKLLKKAFMRIDCRGLRRSAGLILLANEAGATFGTRVSCIRHSGLFGYGFQLMVSRVGMRNKMWLGSTLLSRRSIFFSLSTRCWTCANSRLADLFLIGAQLGFRFIFKYCVAVALPVGWKIAVNQDGSPHSNQASG